MDFSLYHLTEKKSRVKSTFVDENHPDTVKLKPLHPEDTRGKQLTKKINNEGK